MGSPRSYSHGIVIYGHLVDLITSTLESVDLKLHYKSGAAILVPRETQEAVTVWNQGKDLRILTGVGAGAKWLAVDPDNGTIQGPAEEPAACPVIREFNDSSALLKAPDAESTKSHTRAGDDFVDHGKLDEIEGIWLIRKGKFLLRRYRDTSAGPKSPEYHLLDAATGALEHIKGDFEGLDSKGLRPLQPAARPGCVWMARNCRNGAVVGLYDMAAFKFEKVRELNDLRFDSMEMWIDEETGKIHAVVNGDLVRIRLR